MERQNSKKSTRYTTIRYLNTGDGYVLCANEYRGPDHNKYVLGTGLDRIVLQVAMQNWNSPGVRLNEAVQL